MTWASTWKDILGGGSSRWKVDDVRVKLQALNYISKYVSDVKDPSQQGQQKPLQILCPLAGDDPFVHHAWLEGHSVISIDLVPEAVAAMRRQFKHTSSETSKELWTVEKASNGKSNIWKHKDGRATLYEGDMLEKRPELIDSFDAVYDKDSFGALDKSMRRSFCQRLAEYTKDGALIYIEVKYKESSHPGRFSGPPFHLERKDLMDQSNFGEKFDYVTDLGIVYDIGVTGMSQRAHILKRKPRDEIQTPQ